MNSHFESGHHVRQCGPYQRQGIATRMLALCLIGWMVAGLLGCRREKSTESGARGDSLPTRQATDVSRSPNRGHWQQAMEPRQWKFPRDHGAHPEYWMEWWYYTGNVTDPGGRRFGFQLTFFRTGVDQRPRSASSWAVRDLYVAHFALSDVAGETIHSFEKSNRSGVGWAGADEATDADDEESSLRIWNAPWETVISSNGHLHELTASAEDIELQLALRSQQSPVLHHGDGLSQKGPSRGNASHYYSLTDLDTSGTIRLGDSTFRVTGSSWMDHEFSSSFLEEGQLGWDWMALQLDNGTQIMLYQIRREDGSRSPFSSGTIVHPDGRRTSLSVDDIQMVPLRHWTSKKTGARFPVAWRVKISPAFDLRVTAVFDEQEMDTSASTGIIYWEGCVDIRGNSPTSRGNVTGKGYLEMTGYDRR